MVHFEAKKEGIKGLPKAELPHLSTLLKSQWYCLIPLIVLVATLIAGHTASQAAFFAILTTIGVSYLRRETRLTPKRLWEAMVGGAKNSLAIGGAVGSIGIIIAVIDLTGLGRIFPDLVLSVAGDSRAIAILLLAAASLILGMGIPVTAAYLITSELAVPILTNDQMGVSLIAAHLIVFGSVKILILRRLSRLVRTPGLRLPVQIHGRQVGHVSNLPSSCISCRCCLLTPTSCLTAHRYKMFYPL